MRRSGQTGNILQFPGDAVGGGKLKAFAVAFYCFIALMIANPFSLLGIGPLARLGSPFAGEEGITLLFLLGLLYHFFIRRRVQQGTYLKRNGILLGIILLLFLLTAFIPTVSVLAIGALYWLMVERGARREAPYFLKFHMATALVLNFFMLMSLLIIYGILSLLGAIASLARLSLLPSSALGILTLVGSLLPFALFWGTALWLSAAAVMGRTPYIPRVTASVRGLV